MKQVISFIWRVSKPFTLHIWGMLCVSLGWSVMVNAQPAIIKRIIDKVMTYPGGQLFHELLPLVGLFMLTGLGCTTLVFYYDNIVMNFFPRQKAYITQTLMKRMVKQSTAFYQRHFAGNLANKLNDVTLYSPELVKVVMDDFATCLFTLICVLYNVSTVQPRFAWMLLGWLTIFLVGALSLLFSNSHLVYGSAESRAQVVGQIVDILTNMMSIRFFGRQRYEISLLDKATTHTAQREKKRDRFFRNLHFFQGFSFWVFQVVCFWWLLEGVVQKQITPGGFVLIFTLNLQILDQFWHLGEKIKDFWEKTGHLSQALKVIHMSAELPQGAKPLVVTQGEIVFDHVHFVYEGPAYLFEDKTVRILGHQKVGLVGYSGSGKSTFVNLVLRLYDVISGHILIDGQDIRDVTKQSLREAISVIPQDCTLFNRTIMENIRYGRLEATDEEVIEAAQKAQIHYVIEKLPYGYQTLAGERGARLSGGQRQRVAIARAILKDAPILILDEATSHLDTLTEGLLNEAFEKIMENKTVLVVAHRLRTLVHMDRILVFDNGRIVQDGPHHELIRQSGLYQALWNMQTEGMLPLNRDSYA